MGSIWIVEKGLVRSAGCLTEGHSLSVLGLYFLQQSGLVDKFKLHEQKLAR